jgi:hypothetical protein
MGKVSLFTIILEKPQAIFMSSEIIRGNLVAKISKRLKINCLKIVVKGFARVHWSELCYDKRNQSSEMVDYDDYEEYLKFIEIFLSKQGNNDCYMENGEHSYPFQQTINP